MYRAYFFVKSGRNASASEITQYRQQTVDHFDINRNERLLLYIHRRPKRVWGSKKNKPPKLPMERAKPPASDIMVNTELALANEVIKGQSQVKSDEETIRFKQVVEMWDYDTVNPSKGIATVFKLPESDTKKLRRAAGGNTKASGYVRIDQQTPASDGVHLVYEVQIGGKSYATVKMQPRMNIGYKQIQNAFATSHNERKVVTIEVAAPPPTKGNGKSTWKPKASHL
ncbi:hypothetical protein BBJ28_00025449 [Nothophytophthora sp. Chile5]|nr:hypothetical protein BBJ28_00025449 [Nothophytophthora sp. Chile5]